MKRAGSPVWVLNAVRKGKLLRATKGMLPEMMRALIKAEGPKTVQQLMRQEGFAGDETPSKLALLLLQEWGLARTKRVEARLGHPYAAMELVYELIDMDTAIDRLEARGK